SPPDGQGPPADAAPSVEASAPSPPYAAVVPLAVDDGPPVPPELDDLLPAPSARRPLSPPAAKGAKKSAANPRSDADAPAAPPWDYGPVPSPAPGTSPSPATAPAAQPHPGDRQEVAAPAQAALPTVKEATRRLSSNTARDSLAAMALTLIVGTGWNVVSARRRRHGWY
ncbi:MAG TPA: hypothetical protein VGL92_17725, partial [Acidimicrobiia bacterium]